MCPLFASTPQQQERFFELFDGYFERWRGRAVVAPAVESQPRKAPAEQPGPGPRLGLRRASRPRNRPYTFDQRSGMFLE